MARRGDWCGVAALRSDRKLTIGIGQGCSHRFANSSFDLRRRHTSDGPRILFAALQDRLRDIVAPSASALGRVAWTHSVAAIVKELAGKEGVGVLAHGVLVLGMLREQGLDLVPGLAIDDRGVKAVVDLTLVGQPPDVDRVRQDLVEMTPAEEAAASRLARPVAFGSAAERLPDQGWP